ncbi:MAG: DNA ligase D [Myxococcota bacterium]
MAKLASLTQYKKKRDFTKTPEPKGAVKKKSGNRYLIQKHAASHLHYDFRLELDGVLKSWAVTRGPSLDPADKRLAVEVEDHPLDYGSFEGTIPKGQYGGGTVMLWDEGTWEPVGDPRAGLKAGKLVLIIHGTRLKGEWTLVRMRPSAKDKGTKNNWLLIKHKDEYVKAGDGDKLLTKHVTSVVTDRTMDEIAAGGSKKKSKMPAFKPPQLATLSDTMPEGKNWIREIKFDGYRGIAYVNGGKATIYTRTGLDWTHKFKSIATTLEKLPIENAILDGEIVVADKQGVSCFKLLQNALSENQDSNLQYYAFDLLYLGGQDLSKMPLLERKELLETLLKAKVVKNRILYSEHFAANGSAMLEEVTKLGLEGVVSKRADLPYASGRGTAWMKTKGHHRQEFVIGGFTPPKHQERGFGSLLLGYYEKTKLIYAGKVGTGFDHKTASALRIKLDALKIKTMPFEEVSTAEKRGAQWVSPKLACEVEFAEWTEDQRLRHPSFIALREDKPSVAIQRDIKISHPERVIYPGTSITKQQLAEYYEAVAPRLLPHVALRPLSMVRCPEGIGSECFFQRHVGLGKSPHLYEVPVDIKGHQDSYMMIKDVSGLISLVQWGVIELHPWGCLAKNPSLPDRVIFDLDPDPSVPWKLVVEGAKEVRARLTELGLESFVKTTGGKGLHIVVPLTPSLTWPVVKGFAKALADSMQSDEPRRYISKANKQARAGKIFVDYLRNDLTSTAVAAYSVRAREGASVSMPLTWAQLKASLLPTSFNIETVPAKIDKSDPWEEFFKIRQKISAAHLRALELI